MLQLVTYLNHRPKRREEVATQVELNNARTDISDRFVSLDIWRIGIGQLHAVENDNLQSVQLGLFPADLVEADLFGHLARDDDLLLRGMLSGVLCVQS